MSASEIRSGLETTAAVLLVSGITLFDTGLAMDWPQGVEDGFGEKSLGDKISGTGIPIVLVSTGIIPSGR